MDYIPRPILVDISRIDLPSIPEDFHFDPILESTHIDWVILEALHENPNSLPSTNTWMDGNYPLEMWNCYTRTLTNFPRTNNISEGSNNAIRSHFGCSNLTVWACITYLKELQSSTDLDLTQFYTHRWTSPSVCRKVKERDDRILSMVRDYNRTDVLNYTRRLGHMFSM